MGMRALSGRFEHGWKAAFPRCAEVNCSRTHRIWQWFSGREDGILFQDRWYCSPQCFESAARRYFGRACVSLIPTPTVRHRVPLGLLLLSRGTVSNSQLRAALQAQRNNGRGQIGQWLEELGFATEQQVTAALGLQWGCPILPSSVVLDPDSAEMVPFRLLECFRMLPVHFAKANCVLYIAFSEGVDYSALYAIEQMLLCRTEACLAGRSTVDAMLARLAQQHREGDFLFEGSRDISEMARIVSGFALKLGTRQVRIVACGEYIWARLAGLETSSLLFRRPAGLQAQPSGAAS